MSLRNLYLCNDNVIIHYYLVRHVLQGCIGWKPSEEENVSQSSFSASQQFHKSCNAKKNKNKPQALNKKP